MAEEQQRRVEGAVDQMVKGLEREQIRKMQDRLARCTMHCNDKARDAFDTGSKEPQVKRQLQTCITQCVDDHLNLIPSMTKKLKETLIAATK